MTGEKFLFVSDVNEKKRTARGIHNKRAHNGKGGAVKFPSDYLSRKEKQAMNGEVKSFRMNEPMLWAEFKAMPNDLKVVYIKALRERYEVPDKEIFKMMGVPRSTGQLMLANIGCTVGHRGPTCWDKKGWDKWIHGIKEPQPVEDQTDEEIESPACDPEAVQEDAPQIDNCEVDALRERIKQLEADNAILEAKLSMVYLIFGKEQE